MRVSESLDPFALASALFLSGALAGCQPATFSGSTSTPETGGSALSGITEAELRDTIQHLCSTRTQVRETRTVEFPKPTQTCVWGNDGNLGYRDLHFQARTEQNALVSLPSDAIICDLEFSFQPQPIYYDDEFLFVFNGRVMASSYDLGPLFESSNGLLIYDWTKMVGRSWSDARPQSYCAGATQGLSTCSFPKTSVNGTISLEFAPDLIQEFFAQSPKMGQHEFKWITTGDNDPTVDCLHEPVNAQVKFTYVRSQ